MEYLIEIFFLNPNHVGSSVKFIPHFFVALLLMVTILTSGAKNANGAQLTTLALRPTDDAYIDSYNGNINYGTTTTLNALNYYFFSICL
jgi:hypothetical protein